MHDVIAAAHVNGAIIDRIRCAIREHFGRRGFNIRALRRRAPELADVDLLAERLAKLVQSGFLSVRSAGYGNRHSDPDLLTVYELAEEVPPSEILVWRSSQGIVVQPGAAWARRIAAIARVMESSVLDYVREVIEADVMRRDGGARC